MNIKTICLTILLLLLALNYASAAERIKNVSYSVSVVYNRGELSEGSIHVWVASDDYDFDLAKLQRGLAYDVPEEECTSELDWDGRCCYASKAKHCYMAEMYSKEGVILYETPAQVELLMGYDAPSDWFDEDGNQIYFGDGSERSSTVDMNAFYLDLPYFLEATTIKVFEQGQEKLGIDLSAFADCELFVSCKSVLEHAGFENSGRFDNCPTECPSGIANNHCDGYKDGKYDIDCAISEDPDCIDNEQWCIEQIYGATPTPQPTETIVTYSFSGSGMFIELSKPAQGELPEEAKAQIISDMEMVFSAINLDATGIAVDVSGGELGVSATVKHVMEDSFTFTPIPEYTTIVRGVSSIEPTPDSFENGVATYNIAPNSITVGYTPPEEFDWVLALIVGLIAIITAFLVKRKLR